MCGIVGLLVKNRSAAGSLGELLLPMFQCMSERGPDSAGLAVFGEPADGERRRFNLYAPDRHYDWWKLVECFRPEHDMHAEIEPIENHAVLSSAVEAVCFN